MEQEHFAPTSESDSAESTAAPQASDTTQPVASHASFMKKLLLIISSALAGMFVLILIIAVVVVARHTQRANRISDPTPQNTDSTNATNASQVTASAAYTTDVAQVSPAGHSYIDPEILQNPAHITWQEGDTVWVASLDTTTGLITPGSEVKVDDQIAALRTTWNGPEFGVDSSGWALYYAKEVGNDPIQLWRATVDGTGVSKEPVTSGTTAHQTQLASKDLNQSSTKLLYINGSWENGTLNWLDVKKPADEHYIADVEYRILPARWVENTTRSLYTFSHRDEAGRLQVSIDDANSPSEMAIDTVTNDDGDKTDPYGWVAPDFNNQLMVLANTDDAVRVYKQPTGDSASPEPYELYSEIRPPEGSVIAQRYGSYTMGSAEPFIWNGKSYVSLVVKTANSGGTLAKDAEVWIVSVDTNDDFAMRCDSGESGVVRQDPEVLVAGDELFVYYNVFSGRKFETKRCHLQPATEAAGTTQSNTAPATDATVSFSAVDTHINDMLDRLRVKGASLIVKDAGGQVVYQKNYGTDFTADTKVPIASASKWLTGATIMTLVEDGLIDLDAPVSDYLDYFAGTGAKGGMTVREMLAFTTGLPGHERVQDDPNITQQQECESVAKNSDLSFDPGTKFSYGGLQEEIAACVAEQVTGKPFRELMQERLLDPLGMTDTALANMVNRRPTNLDFESANPLTSGGVYTSANDLIKFSEMILNHGEYQGTQVLADSTIAGMQEDQTNGVPIEGTIWSTEDAPYWRYGLGNWVQVLDPHTGSTETETKRLLSSEGALGTSEWVDFDAGYAAAFTTWGKAGQMPDFVNDLKNLVSDAVE